MATRVLLTGANGFVGSHITDCLLRRGYQVRAMVRTTSDLTWLHNKPVELVYGSLDNPTSLRAAVEGVERVIHNAGVVYADHRSLYFLHNSEGTRHLINAVLEVHPPGDRPRFLFVSSQAAAGPSGQRWRRECDPPSPITDYGRSKLLAETILLRHQDELPLSIVRPPSVYGPRDRAFLSFFRMIARGFMPLTGSGHLISFVHVQDLARQIGDQLEHERAVGEIFHAAPFDPVTLREFGDTIANVLNTSPLLLPVPPALLKLFYPLAHPALQIARAAPFPVDKLPDIVNPRWTLDGSKARELIGFKGQLPLLAGIGQTAEWYRWKKWLLTRRDQINEKGDARAYSRPIAGTQRLFDEGCDLCGLAFDREIKTPIHYEDDDFIIVDCMICRVPMAVLKEHRAAFTPEEKERLAAIFTELFGVSEPDFEQRRIPGHAHVHNRREGHAPPWTRRSEETFIPAPTSGVNSNSSPRP